MLTAREIVVRRMAGSPKNSGRSESQLPPHPLVKRGSRHTACRLDVQTEQLAAMSTAKQSMKTATQLDRGQDAEIIAISGRRLPSHRGERITMLLENNPYPQDPRVRREAESLVLAGHAVEVIAPRRSGQPKHEQVNGVRVRRYRTLKVRSGTVGILLEYLVAWFALHAGACRALLRGSTVLHLHNPPDIFFLAGALFRLAGRQVVFDHHDLSPELVTVKFSSRVLRAVAQIAERLTFAVATHVLAPNESHAEIARARGGMRPDQVTVVRNGAPAAWMRLPLQLRRNRLRRVRLAYLGSIADQDGLDGIAEVLACLRDRTPRVMASLTIIGDGDAREKVEQALAHWSVGEDVEMVGWVSADEVPDLLQSADICVDPAPATELNERSTMIKLMEYLALGKPVVAYDILESRRTVEDAALLVPPGDAPAFAERIAMLATDPELRVSLAMRARERARELTWEQSEVSLLAAYEHLNRKRALRSGTSWRPRRLSRRGGRSGMVVRSGHEVGSELQNGLLRASSLTAGAVRQRGRNGRDTVPLIDQRVDRSRRRRPPPNIDDAESVHVGDIGEKAEMP